MPFEPERKSCRAYRELESRTLSTNASAAIVLSHDWCFADATFLPFFLELWSSQAVVRIVTQSAAALAMLDEPVWFCLRGEPKREHLAAISLRRLFGIECLSPRLRFRKLTQRGPVWFVEAMFPGYLFARFVYSTQRRAVESSHGIRGIVRFGDRLAILPEEIVAALQSKAGSDEIVTVDSSLKIGQ